MQTKSFLYNNLTVSYIDNGNESDLTLLFIHGNSLRSELFKQQVTGLAFNQFRVIAPDFPGHGRSGRSQNPEVDYSVLGYIDMLKQLVLELKLKNIVLVGHSLGGHIAIHLQSELKKAQVKVCGIAIMGTPPLTLPPKMEQAFLPNPAMALVFKPNLSDDEIFEVANAFIHHDSAFSEDVKKTIASADPMVRPSIGMSIATQIQESEVDILNNSEIPIAVIHGENDSLVNANYINSLGLRLWQDKIHTINAGHIPFLEQPSQFNSILQRFIQSIQAD
jgi:pimeloyl-ACP methyl ester carboxylesterase